MIHDNYRHGVGTVRYLPNGKACIGVLLLACGLLAAAVWWPYQTSALEEQPYDVAIVTRGSVKDLIAATGTIAPRNYVDVGAQVSGQIKNLNVEVGSVVQPGDQVAEIDPTVYRADVNARRALLRKQRAVRSARKAELELAELKHDRQKRLRRQNAISEQALESVAAREKVARAQLEAVGAAIGQTQHALRSTQAKLGYTTIYAPMAGVVVSISTREGQTVNASQRAPVILRIADLSSMTVNAHVSEGDVGDLYKGMDVYFTTLRGRQRWKGKLRKVNPTPTVSSNVVLYDALFDVENTNKRLLPKMTAKVFFVLDHVKHALVVPTAAVTIHSGGEAGQSAGGRPPTSAWTSLVTTVKRTTDEVLAHPPSQGRSGSVRVLKANGEVETRTVKVGISNRRKVEILNGLSEGDRVIIGARETSE